MFESKDFSWPAFKRCGVNKTRLKYNECCFDIKSKTSYGYWIYARSTGCVNCKFIYEYPKIEPYGSYSFVLNTDYPVEFNIQRYGEVKCKNSTYTFGDLGHYYMEVSSTGCSKIQVKSKPESALLNFGVILSAFVSVLVIYGLYLLSKKCFHMSRRQVSFQELETDLGNPDARDQNKAFIQARTKRLSRIAAVDVFRGITMTIMVFANYGGGGYALFRHAPWDGLTIADLVFPWFVWLMGLSTVLFLRSKLRTSVPKSKILGRIVKRSLTLMAIGLVLNTEARGNSDAADTFSSLRIPGVLQRIGFTYLIVALMELAFIKPQRSEQFGPWNLCADIVDSPVQWIIALILVAAHTLITFMLPVPGCPTGYLGPGGLHEYEKFRNCTGGAAGYIDRHFLTNKHLYQRGTMRKMYHNPLPHDPEGILGSLTCIFCAFLGVHAGRIILSFESTSARIRRWLIWGAVLGLVAGLLCNFVKNDGYIPVNKNLWSLSYVCVTSSFAFILLSLLYLIVDYRRIWGGSPFVYAGMNALAVYVGHELMRKYFPWHWKPFTNLHIEILAENTNATVLWVIIAYVMYRKNIFITL